MNDPVDAQWVTIAVLGKARGNRGEVTAWSLSDKPERYERLHEVYLFGAVEGRFEVESTWFHQETLIFKFRTVDTISDAERLNGCEVRLPIGERTPLEPGEFFQSDLVGCEVVDRRTGDLLGHVSGWQDSGGPGLLVVDGDLLIPFARAICVEINPAARRIAVELPEGLKDLNRP
ncbi:MAG TPA: ribosome maturation factor RimM [Bryobacteraceae bacterium]|nr:ribosome maturation factor RimM [Bryobacteraceae bacterium]